VAQRIAEAGGPNPKSSSSNVRGRLATAPLSEIGGKRLFVKELKDALLSVTSTSPSTAARTCGRAAEGSRSAPYCQERIPQMSWCCRRRSAEAGHHQFYENRKRRVRPSFTIRERLGQARASAPAAFGASRSSAAVFPAPGFRTCAAISTHGFASLTRADYESAVLAAAGSAAWDLPRRLDDAALDDCIRRWPGIIAIETRAATHRCAGRWPAVMSRSAAALDADAPWSSHSAARCQMPIGGVAVSAGPSALELSAIVASSTARAPSL